MSKRQQKRSGRALFPFILFIALLILLSTGKRGFIQQIRVRMERARIEKNLKRLEAVKKQLEEDKKKLNDPAVVEKIAREDYGMAKENEKVLHVVPKKGEK